MGIVWEAPVAQRIERTLPMGKVGGSNPSGGTRQAGETVARLSLSVIRKKDLSVFSSLPMGIS